MKKPKKFWISRESNSDFISIWTHKPIKEKFATSIRYRRSEKCKESIRVEFVHREQFKALFGKELVEGGCVQVSFNMEVFL